MECLILLRCFGKAYGFCQRRLGGRLRQQGAAVKGLNHFALASAFDQRVFCDSTQRTAARINSGAVPRPSFCLMFTRWTSTVLGLT